MTTTVKTKLSPKAIVQQLSNERTEHLAAMVNQRDQLITEHDEHVARADSILAAWARGDDSNDAAELDAVRGESERTGLLLDAAERGVRQATRRLVNLDDGLASLLVPAIEAAYAVNVETSTTEPTETPTILPTLLIVQLESAAHSPTSGALHGHVELRYYRTEAHAPLTKERLTAHLGTAGIRADVGREYGGIFTSDIAGGKVDVAAVVVLQAFDETPAITSPGGLADIKSFGAMIAYELEGQYVQYSNTGQAAYPNRVRSHGAALTSSIAKGSETITTIRVDVDYGPGGWLREDMQTRIVMLMSQLSDKSYAGLGRLTEAKTAGTKSLMGQFGYPTGAATTIIATFISAAPERSVA